jgi:two-component system, NtrC family, sensor histidine kinase KinB
MTKDATQASLELLYNISRELTSSLNLHNVLSRVLFLFTKNVGAERGSLIVLDEEQKPVEGAIVLDGQLDPHKAEQLQATLDQGLAGWVVQNKEPVLIDNTANDERWLHRPDDEENRTGPKSAICIPLLVQNELVGVLTLVHPEIDFFSKEKMTLLQTIAGQAGIAIYNARLYNSLQATNRRYYQLFEDSLTPIIITDRQGKILEANRLAIQFLGASLKSLEQHNILDLHLADVDALGDDCQNVQQDNTVTYESQLYPLNGDSIPVEMHVRQVNIAGHENLQWIVEDITQRKKLETLRNDLTAMIYHDLRSPLSNIISSLEMLPAIAPDEYNPMLEPVLSITKRSTERMQRMIRSLLDINRLETGQRITDPAPVLPRELLGEAISTVEPISAHKKQIINMEVDKDLPQIKVDADMIKRVLINLLENASKFTPIGENISAGAEMKTPECICFWVQDNGPGIPEDVQDEIFDKFTTYTSPNLPKGIGLGLAFCKLAVQAHGGKIWVESEAMQGSRFFFQIPTDTE